MNRSKSAKREQCLAMIAEGKPQKDVAAHLGMSVSWVCMVKSGYKQPPQPQRLSVNIERDVTGRAITHRRIAELFGVSTAMIQQDERNGMRKLKRGVLWACAKLGIDHNDPAILPALLDAFRERANQ